MAKCEVVFCLLLVCIQYSSLQYSKPRFRHPEDENYAFTPRSRNIKPPPPKPIEPCNPSNYRLIRNQPQRSYNYRLGSSTSKQREEVLCDRDLRPGWYRFDSLAGNTIPTSCPGVNYCGTRAPVWMKGSLPTVDEGIIKAHGCVSVQGKCCTTQIPMLVKNCTDFVVYHLQPTPACPSAYCAGYEVPCPVGLSSENGYTPCHFPVDLVETKVSFGMSKDLSKVQFFCDVTLGGQVVPESVALEVEWLADEETIQSETFGLVEHHKGVLKEDKWTLGQTLQCRARARHTSINTFTALVTSPPFNTGILVTSPSPLTLNEGGEPGFIEFQLSTPITCPPKKKKKKGEKERKREKRKEEETEEQRGEEEGCCITFEISTRGSNTPRCPDGTQFDLVVLNSCSYKVCGDEWNITHRIPVWAVNDGLTGGKESGDNEPSTVLIDFRTVEPSPPRWQEIALPSQEIIVTHGDVEEKCLMDEATTTFDGLTYVNRLEGIFILYKHENLPYEVQVQLKKCNQREICNCAIAVRFGEAMLAADICSTGKLKLWSYTAEGGYIEPSKLTHLPQIVRIDDGRSFQIQLPTGTRVNFGPNLRFIKIQASLSDLDHTVGLCGSFDRNPSNDLSTYKGSSSCQKLNSSVQVSCDDFTKGWRLLPEHSLFQGAFSNDVGSDGDEQAEEHAGPGHCSCSELKISKPVDLRPKQKAKFSSYPYDEYGAEEQGEEDQDANNNKCSSKQCVDPRGVDVSNQLLELLLDEDFLPEDENFGRLSEKPVLLEPAFGGEKNPVLAQESSKKEWKEEEAEVFCLRMIEGVPTAKLCRDIAHVDVDIHTKACKHEVLHTQSAIWSIDALEQLRWECRDQVYHNRTIWEPQLGRQHGTPPLGVLSTLCLNNCTGQGSCQNGVCLCSSGFSSSDCSVSTKLGPRATHLNNRGVCDLRNKPCSEVLVWGDGFADESNIKCHFDIYRTVNVKSVPTLSGTLTTNGKLLTYQSIICDVPELPIHDAKIASFYIPGEGIDKTRTLMQIHVSYGIHGQRSPPLDYTIYDSLCWSCEGALACSPTPTQSCNVLSEPFGSGSDPFLQNHSPFSEASFIQSSLPLQPLHSSFNSHGTAGQVPLLHPTLSGPCLLLKDPGPCKNDIVRYYFDGEKCKPFIFGGCQGNANNFASEDTCSSLCVKPKEGGSRALAGLQSDPQNLKSSDLITTLIQLPEKCRHKPDGTSCSNPEIIQYYYDVIQKKCRPTIACEAQAFSNQQSCENECGERRFEIGRKSFQL